MPANKACRKAAAANIIRLAQTLHTRKRGPFRCSRRFRTAPLNPDEVEPLDEMRWDSKTKRYRMHKGSVYHTDDAILQAMVILFVVARLQHGWKQTITCAQLSTWPKASANSGLPPLTSLPREWDEEIDRAVKNKSMNLRIRDSVNNYNTISGIYSEDRCWSRECRTGDGSFPTFHRITEQSIVQWALDYRTQEEWGGAYCSELSVLLLKTLLVYDLKARDRVAVAAKMYDVLLEVGLRDDPTTFAKDAIAAVEKIDLERAIETFREESFLNEHLPSIGPGQRSRGIYKHPIVRWGLIGMVRANKDPE